MGSSRTAEDQDQLLVDWALNSILCCDRLSSGFEQPLVVAVSGS